MKEVKIYALHPSCKDVESFIRYTKLFELKDKYNLVWTDCNPKILIATEHIYTNLTYKKRFKQLYSTSEIRVFFSGEACATDFNIFDYGIGFDETNHNNDRYVQILPPFDFFYKFLPKRENDINEVSKALDILQQKKGFCNFLYSNPSAHPNRDRLFYKLSTYKKVDSLGRHLNNVGNKATGYQGHAQDCIGIKNPYKFSIASENARYLGYTSEKVFTSLAAHTVPIYWGDPHVTRIINPKAIINTNEYKTFDEVIEAVKEIDSNDMLWAQMIAEPWQTAEQIEYCEKRKRDYIKFFEHLFSKESEDLERAPKGTFPTNYHRYFFNEKKSLISRTRKALGKIKKSFFS